MALTKAHIRMTSGGTLSPLQYGAVGDGVTNDATALAAAIAAADGGTLDLGGQNYLITSVVLASCPNGITLQNGKITCNFASQAESAVRITSDDVIRVNNITVNGQDTCAKGLFLRSNGTTTKVFVSDSYFYNVLQTADTGLAAALYINPEDSGDAFDSVQIDNCRFDNVDSSGGTDVGRGVVVKDSTHTLVTNSFFSDIGPYQDGDGILVTDDSVTSGRRFVIDNCVFTDCQKRAIKSQVARTRVSNIIVRRRSNFTAAAGQCDVAIQRGGIINGLTCYFNNGCAPSSFINTNLYLANEPVQIRNVVLVAEDPTDIVDRVIDFSQADDIYSLDTVVEGIYGNCKLNSLIQTSGEGFSSDPGSSSSYLFDNLIIRDVRFANGFNPSPSADASTGQDNIGLFRLSRSATAYIQVRFRAYEVKIGSDNTIATAYLSSGAGSVTYLKADLVEHANCEGFDTSTYDGTGAATYTVTYVPERIAKQFISRTSSVAGDGTASIEFDVPNEGGCKVIVTYGCQDTAGTKLYTEGIVVNGGGATDYFETVAGDKTSTQTGTISVTTSGNNFTVAKTAGSSSLSGQLNILIFNDGEVREV